MNPTLLEILVCPETHQPLQLAGADLLGTLNGKIQEGTLRNRAGQLVSRPLEAGLLRADQKCLYPVRQDIPIMLIEESIPLE